MINPAMGMNGFMDALPRVRSTPKHEKNQPCLARIILAEFGVTRPQIWLNLDGLGLLTPC